MHASHVESLCKPSLDAELHTLCEYLRGVGCILPSKLPASAGRPPKRSELLRALCAVKGVSLRVLLHSPYRETVLHMHAMRKQKREQAQARAQAQQPPCSAPVLWLGDSILHDLVGTGELGWRYVSARFPSTNLGICGETAELCRQRVVGVLEGSATRSGHASPRAVVLMTGTNNLANDTAADVVSKVLSVVSELGERHKWSNDGDHSVRAYGV